MEQLKNYREVTLFAKDKITGFSGIITGHADYITGCDQYLIQPQCKESHAFNESRWFDENRIEIINSGGALHKKSENVYDNGAGIPAPTK